MSYVQHIVKALPGHLLTQEDIRAMGKRILKGRVPFLDQALNLFGNAGVSRRYIVRKPEEILANDNLGWRNRVFREACLDLGRRMMRDLFEQTGIDPGSIDLFVTTSCTGFMIPAIDAYLINEFGLKPSVKRLPVTELGCAAGAMALSRAHEYLLAFPRHKALVMAIELPSLTYQTGDFRMANLVSAALFGDGGATVLLNGVEGPCEILGNRTHFFNDTIGYMGFDLDERGFKIILDKKIPQLVESGFKELVIDFLAAQGFTLDQMRHFLFHPGGRRILDTMRDCLGLREEDIACSRKVLRDVGNLSSATVLWVLDELLHARPRGYGIMSAFGPGFNAEFLALRFQ